MKRVARFHKVSFEQYKKDWEDIFGKEEESVIREVWEQIKLPARATKGSAGYDFYAPKQFSVAVGKTVMVPTGIRVEIENGWVLKCYPRSGFGFKFRLQLNNTVGIIDSDYFFAENEGHIFAKMTNDSREGKNLIIDKGVAFMQGVFVEYGITFDDEAEGIRTGGLGSTTK